MNLFLGCIKKTGAIITNIFIFINGGKTSILTSLLYPNIKKQVYIQPSKLQRFINIRSNTSIKNTKFSGDICIGNNCKIAGTEIDGNGVVVAAGSVVTRDVPDYAIVSGTPTSVRKFRFDEFTIIKLLELEWWNWPEEKTRQHQNLFKGSFNIDGFK